MLTIAKNETIMKMHKMKFVIKLLQFMQFIERSKIMENLIRKKREELNLKQKDLAKKLGVSVSTMCRIEKGIVKPKGKRAIKLSKLLNIPVEKIIV